MNDEDGKRLNELEIVDRLKEHFENMYKADTEVFRGGGHIEEYLNGIEHPVLGEEERDICESPITLEELNAAVKSINTNSAPGCDGLTAEFYKFFWSRLRAPLYESLMESIEQGELSVSQKRGIISLIPKGNNLNNSDVNNWRPITLTNTDYKIITKVLACRLQAVISTLIHPNQSGFLKGRNISHHIRLIDEIIDFSGKTNKKGLVLSLDFQKAFDSITKESILGALQKFNFGPFFTSLIQTIMTNTESSVQNGGWISRFFLTERGIRQGCCVSPLLFVLVVEMLAIKIRGNVRIKGITLPGQESNMSTGFKILQYADDATLILKGERDLELALKDIEDFYFVSGLKLNRKKSHGLWIGADAQSPKTPGDITWVKEGQCIKILGIYFNASEEASLIDLNWKNKIDKVQNIIARWQRRNISLYGKIIIAKTFLLSQFTYILQALALPLTVLNTIDSMIFKFLWKKKVSNTRAFEKVKRVVLCKNITEGGLNMISVKDQQKVFLLKWLQRVVTGKSEIEGLYGIPHFFFAGLGGVKYFVESAGDDQLLKRNHNIIPSIYWSHAARVWTEINKENACGQTSLEEILSQTLFNNRSIKYKGKVVFFKKWVKSGITHLHHLFQDSEVKTFLQMKEIIGNHPGLILEYNVLINAIPSEWLRKAREGNTEQIRDLAVQLSTESAEKALQFLNQPTRQIREFLNHRPVSICGKNFWMNKLGVDITKNYEIADTVCKESRLRLLHFKILHNIFPTNILLNRMKISSTELCEFCRVPDFLEHFFVACKKLEGYWEHVFRLINSLTKFQFGVKTEWILFGITQGEAIVASKADLKLANHTILLGKVCVSKMRYGKIPNIFVIFELEWCLRKSYICAT